MYCVFLKSRYYKINESEPYTNILRKGYGTSEIKMAINFQAEETCQTQHKRKSSYLRFVFCNIRRRTVTAFKETKEGEQGFYTQANHASYTQGGESQS